MRVFIPVRVLLLRLPKLNRDAAAQSLKLPTCKFIVRF